MESQPFFEIPSYLLNMERINKKRDLVFNYLDMISSEIKIHETDYGMYGNINDKPFFRYYSKRNQLSFDRSTFDTICMMFDISQGSAADYIKVYLSKKFNPSFITSTFFPSL
jgi:hypothetical protein